MKPRLEWNPWLCWWQVAGAWHKDNPYYIFAVAYARELNRLNGR